MNYLAHIYLSGDNPDIQVGGLLGDFVKGPLSGNLPAPIEAGIALHRAIDSSTDRHPHFRRIMATIPPPWRRYGGIIVDLYLDHLLASHWSEFHQQPLSSFCANFYRHLNSHWALLPERAQHFCRVAPEVNWLENYANAEHLPRMLSNIGKRLRKPVALNQGLCYMEQQASALTECLGLLLEEHRGLAQQFLSTRDLYHQS